MSNHEPGLVLEQLRHINKYKVFIEGSRTYVVDQFNRIANSNTDTYTAVQEILDALVNGDLAYFLWDDTQFTLTNPLNPPASSSALGDRYVIFQGYFSDSINAGTRFVPDATFPTEHCAIECETSLATATETCNFRCDGFHLNGRTFARHKDGGNIFGGGTVIDFGGVKLSHGANSKWPCRISNIFGTYLWRGVHLSGQVWFSNFWDWHFIAPNVNFLGDHLILLEQGGHAHSAANPTVKANNFRNIKGSLTGIYKNFLRMKSGNYNHFSEIFPDGAIYTEAIFNLDNTDTAINSAYIMGANHFDHIQSLDNNTAPSPDNRLGGTLYLNGDTVIDNTFKDCRLTNYPKAVKLAGGARRNTIELSGYYGNLALVDDDGAGPENVIIVQGGFNTSLTILPDVESTSGIVGLIDNRRIKHHGGDILIGDGTHWWLAGPPGALSTRKYGTLNFSVGVTQDAVTADIGNGILNSLSIATGAGTTQSLGGTTGKRYRLVTGAVSGNKAGYRLSSNFMLASNDPKMRFLFDTPAASDHTNSRMFFGFAQNTEPTGDTPLANLRGVMFGYRTTDSNYQIFRNDGSATATYTDTGVGLDTDDHEVKIVCSLNGTKWSVSVDGGVYTDFTTAIPGSSLTLTPIFYTETAAAAAKNLDLISMAVQTEE